MIYTTYFAKLKQLPEDIVPISICAKSPDWYNGLEYKPLAPHYDLLTHFKRYNDEEYYTEYFHNEVLRNLNPFLVKKQLEKLSNKKDIALICYEKSSDFCHRHLVAEWFNGFDIRCEEYNFDNKREQISTPIPPPPPAPPLRVLSETFFTKKKIKS